MLTPFRGACRTKGHEMKLFIFAIPALLAAAEVTPPDFQIVLQYGALGVLTWFCFAQQHDLVGLRKSLADSIDNIRKLSEDNRKANEVMLDKICDRQDGWEKIRHADSEKHDDALRKLDEALRTIVTQCEKRNPHIAGT